jgi:hypothetical protein
MVISEREVKIFANQIKTKKFMLLKLLAFSATPKRLRSGLALQKNH